MLQRLWEPLTHFHHCVPRASVYLVPSGAAVLGRALFISLGPGALCWSCQRAASTVLQSLNATCLGSSPHHGPAFPGLFQLCSKAPFTNPACRPASCGWARRDLAKGGFVDLLDTSCPCLGLDFRTKYTRQVFSSGTSKARIKQNVEIQISAGKEQSGTGKAPL